MREKRYNRARDGHHCTRIPNGVFPGGKTGSTGVRGGGWRYTRGEVRWNMRSLPGIPVKKPGPSAGPVPQRGLGEDLLAFPVGLDDRDFHVRIVGDRDRQIRCLDHKRSPFVEFSGDGKPVVVWIVFDGDLDAILRVCPWYDSLAIDPERFAV